MQIQRAAEAELRERIKSTGMRMNKTKLMVFQLLHSVERPMSVQEIAAQITEVHFVSIYRTVDALRRAGVIVQVPQGFKNLFELSDAFKPHHHHISCENCGRLSSINDREIEDLIEKIALDSGYKSTRHHLELYGLCRACRGEG